MASDYQVTIKKFGKNVKSKRTELKYSQEDLALKTGLDRTYVSGIERGERNPTIKIVILLSKALKASISELFDN